MTFDLFEDSGAWERVDLRPVSPEIVYEQSFTDAANATELGIRRLRGGPSQAQHRKGREQVRELFEELRAQWAEETEFSSSIAQAATHSAYQRIIGLGPEALPFIFQQLREDPSPKWFWALRAIVGEDKAASSEGVQEAVDEWLSWAAEEGYV
ncbi:hypothetical protein [Streptomyces sp. NBC_00582]|uniref:hypothetical protein n=1 Tax=Streptomyces sp. NBC_00582 TaxID=2975783 RepID=UPI002E81624A|nr:hypothetical protein [Streptomyces sp. NBC_00582]WUB60918.1 hypothetical protein OG852_11235 [Streptomyces sp. NBC_00582]